MKGRLVLKVLITGATGFVGKHLTRYLYENHRAEIYGTTYAEPDLTSDPEFSAHVKEIRALDIRDGQAVKEFVDEVQPDHIYHLAAQSSPGLSFGNPWDTLETNIRGTLNVFEAVRSLELTQTRVLNISSAAIYGLVESQDLPLTEKQAFNPGSPYDVSKVAQDLLGTQYARAFGLYIVGARPFNHSGAGHSEVFVFPNFAIQIAKIERGLAEPVLRVGNLSAERDYLDVRDVVRAYVLLIEHGKPGQAYNICSGHSHSIRSFVDKLLSFATVPIQIEVDESRLRPIDLPRLVGDNTALRKQTGWKPQFTIDDMLLAVLEDCRQRVNSQV